MSQIKTFSNSKTLKAQKLFVETNIWLAILKVALPGLLISLMSGIYIFADQLLMALLIPTDGVHDFYQTFGYSIDEAKKWIEAFNTEHTVSLTLLDTSSIIKSAISISAPLTMILNAMPFLAGIGAGVMYTQTLSKNNHLKGQEVWKTSFYSAVVLAIFSSIFFSLFNDLIIHAAAGTATDLTQITGPNPIEGSNDWNVIQYFNKAREMQLKWAGEYTLVIAAGSMFNIMIAYFSFMIRAEGRMAFVTIAAVCCNVINIALDLIFLKIAKLGMLGGGCATCIGWFFNFMCYLCYIFYLSKKELTWMKFRYLKVDRTLRFSWTLLIPIFVIGLSVFLRNFSNSIANILFMSSLNDVGNNLVHGQGQYFQTLSGAVLPINNLFFYAIFGLVDGIRPLCAYNHGQSNYKRVKQTYWITILCSVVYGVLVFGLMVSPFGTELLSWFSIPKGSQEIVDASLYLMIQCLLITFASISIGGLMIFQSTNRMGLSIFAGLLQGAICYPITLFAITTPLAYTVWGMAGCWIVVATNSLNGLIASIITFTMSVIFIYRFLGKSTMKIKMYDEKTKSFINKKLFVDLKAPKMSYAQLQLEKPSNRGDGPRLQELVYNLDKTLIKAS